MIQKIPDSGHLNATHLLLLEQQPCLKCTLQPEKINAPYWLSVAKKQIIPKISGLKNKQKQGQKPKHIS